MDLSRPFARGFALLHAGFGQIVGVRAVRSQVRMSRTSSPLAKLSGLRPIDRSVTSPLDRIVDSFGHTGLACRSRVDDKRRPRERCARLTLVQACCYIRPYRRLLTIDVCNSDGRCPQQMGRVKTTRPPASLGQEESMRRGSRLVTTSAAPVLSRMRAEPVGTKRLRGRVLLGSSSTNPVPGDRSRTPTIGTVQTDPRFVFGSQTCFFAGIGPQ